MTKTEPENLKPEETSAEVVEKDLEDAGIIPALDGGYGWAIVFASFLCNFVVDGVIFTVGEQFLPKWIADFQISDTSAALVMSFLSGCYLLVGPLASALCNIYGCRSVVFAGSVIAFFGFIISTSAPNIIMLYFSFGIVGGIGFGLIYLPAIVIIPEYFSKKRSMATGMAVCGSGIGTTVFSMLNPYVMAVAGDNWRFFVVFVAFVSLLAMISVLIYRDVRASKEQIGKVADIVEIYDKDHPLGGEPGLYGAQRSNFSDRPFLSTVEHNTQSLQHNAGSQQLSHRDLLEAVAEESIRELNRPLSRMDIFYTGSTQNLQTRGSRSGSFSKRAREHSSVASVKGSTVYLSRVTLPAETTGPGETCPSSGWRYGVIMFFNALYDKELFQSCSFIILAISGFLTLSCFYVPYNYLGNHLDKIPGLEPKWRALPIALLGVINILARIVCGWIADQPSVDALLVTNVALISAGLATCAVPFFTQYWHFIAFCIPFACGVACFAALRSVICVDLFGLEKLSNAFGVLLTFMGFGAIIGSPATAFIKDQTGNFDISFYIMGSIMAMSGLICLPLRKLRNWEIKKYSSQENALNETELTKLNS